MFYDLFLKSPIPASEILQNLGLYINRQTLSRILFMHELYLKIINIHGIIIEFGTRWGQNLALFESFRGIYEPYNYSRKIVGFDTFEGFLSLNKKDGDTKVSQVGAYSVTENYEEYLTSILNYHESESPLSHIKKYEIIKGDVMITFKEYLDKNPETIVSLVYFDLDLYDPTKKCLELIESYLTKGSVIGFDELCFKDFPGETIAVREVLGLDKYKIQRTPLNPFPSYVIIE
ncbi:MAG: crotonobetainyl-CoA--carnitine CoA-transferase [Promethearchaeota archaeon]